MRCCSFGRFHLRLIVTGWNDARRVLCLVVSLPGVGGCRPSFGGTNKRTNAGGFQTQGAFIHTNMELTAWPVAGNVWTEFVSGRHRDLCMPSFVCCTCLTCGLMMMVSPAIAWAFLAKDQRCMSPGCAANSCAREESSSIFRLAVPSLGAMFADTCTVYCTSCILCSKSFGTNR